MLAVAAIIVAGMPDERIEVFGGSFVVDGFAQFLKILALVGSAGAILLSGDFRKDPERRSFEYPVLILLATSA